MSTSVKLLCLSAALVLGLTSPLYAQSLGSFVPINYAILDTVSGDLNMDAFPDMIMILKTKQESDTSESDRPLLILEGISKGKYKLAGRNDNIVFCASCGGAFGDPYQAVTIEKGSFTVSLYGGSAWRWTQDITFSFQPASGKYMLHTDVGSSFNSTKPNKVKKIKNQKQNWDKVTFEEYSNNEDAD